MMNGAMYKALRDLGYPCESRYGEAVIAVSHAAYGIIVGVFSTTYRSYGDDLMRTVSRRYSGNRYNNAILIGRQASQSILADRADDNATYFKDYLLDPTPGKWVPTLGDDGKPSPPNPFMPHWGQVRPFGVEQAAPYVPTTGPPSFSSDAYYNYLKEARDLGNVYATDSGAAARASTAIFWEANTFSPHAIWLNIARQILSQTTSPDDIYKYAAVYYLMSCAGADGRIVAYRTKYIYNTWRPETAITSSISVNARLDELKDPNWKSVFAAPLHPDFPSGHSSVCHSAGGMLTKIFGPNIQFSIPTADSGSTTHSYASISDAADECGLSRIYAGIHFRFAVDAGTVIGARLSEDGFSRLCNEGSCFSCGQKETHF